jgi:hypothetical protein
LPGYYTDVDVTTDATGLVPGVYKANLCVNSNDPATPLEAVPVEMTVNNVPPEGSVDPGTQWPQYSDEITPILVSATDNIAEVLSATTSWSSDGVTFNPGLPDFLVISAPSCMDTSGGMQTCTWTISGVIDLPEGYYTVRTTISDDFGGVTVIDTIIEVVPEAASAVFDTDNPVAVPVIDPGGDSEPFSLSVYVTERVPDLPANPGDGVAPGDISRASVTVTLAPVGPGSPVSPTSCTTSVAPVGYAGEMTITCDFDSVPVNTYTLQVVVGGGYYTGLFEDVVVIYDPSLGFTTGGGWFYWPGTEDPENNYAGDKTNFGFVMRYNRKGQRVRGNFLLIRHTADGLIFRLKSNALYGLALGEDPSIPMGWATFSGKTTYLEPGMPEPIGNHEFIVYVEDWGEPGTGGDGFWVEVHDRDGEVIAILSLDRDAADNLVPLGGGNIVVPH